MGRTRARDRRRARSERGSLRRPRRRNPRRRRRRGPRCCLDCRGDRARAARPLPRARGSRGRRRLDRGRRGDRAGGAPARPRGRAARAHGPARRAHADRGRRPGIRRHERARTARCRAWGRLCRPGESRRRRPLGRARPAPLAGSKSAIGGAEPNRYPVPMPQLASFEKALRFGEGRRLKRLREQAEYIGKHEPDLESLSDAELAGKTAEFRQRLENGEPLEELIFEAFAAVREAAKRALGQRHFDVQVMGATVLHEGDIAEMKTGEGKTLVATMPLYLNALPGTGVHLVTVNDYLAKRDAEWMSPVYEKLGMRAGFIRNMMPYAERKEAYAADITYGTNSEFGFDYLRDNMAVALEGLVQRSHSYAIVDEVDSILIDEARTPLIISGEPETAAKIYYDFARVAKTLEGVPASDVQKGEPSGADYEYDEKRKTVAPTERGIDTVERALKIEHLYAPQNA